jgi:uncharacterized protein (TIGR02145 family)
MKNLILILLFASIALLSKAQKRDSSFIDTRDGKKYKTVKIGTQTWMAENLAYKADSGCRAFDNKDSIAAIYGYLYNWETAQKVCPKGWHLPSDAEWTILVDYLGGWEVAGGKMKEAGTAHWKRPNKKAKNSSGFTALPAGFRYYLDGSFKSLGYSASYFCSDEEWFREIKNKYAILFRPYNRLLLWGGSVRCLKD